MKNILSILFLLLSSCGFVNKLETFPIGVNANDEADLEVIDYYNETFGLEIFIDDESGVQINRVDEVICDSITDLNCLGLITFKTATTGNHRIDILENMQDNLYFCILAHELGHVLIKDEHLESGLMKVSAECSTDKQSTIDDLFFDYVSEMYNL